MKRSFVVVVCSLIFAISLVACGGGGGGGAGTTPAVEQLVNGSSAASTTTSWYCEYDGNTGSSTNANFNIFDLFSDQTGYDAYYGTFTWRTDGDTAAYIALPTSEIRMFDITGTLASGTARYCYNGPTYFNCSLKDCSSGFTDG